MRRFALTLAMVSICAGTFGQGTITFNNALGRLFVIGQTRAEDHGLGGGTNSGSSGAIPSSPLPSGLTLIASLYAGTNASFLFHQISLDLMGANFLSPGRMTNKPVVLTGIPGAQTNYFQVVLTDSSGGRPAILNGAGTSNLFGGSYFGASGLFTAVPSASNNFPLLTTNNYLAYSTWPQGNVIINVTAPVPPAIIFQPLSQSVFLGGDAILSTTGFSTYPFSYQWRKGNNLIVGSTNNTLSFTNVTLDDIGSYSIVVSNSLGTATSSNAVLQVLPPNAPNFRVDGLLVAGTVTVGVAGTVTIAGGFPGGVIFYTLDGTTPTPASALYVGPVTINSDATLRAISLSSDFTQTSEAPAVNVIILPIYALTKTTVGNGTIEVAPTTSPHVSNSVAILTAKPAFYWAFDHWSGDLSGNANPSQLVMNSTHNVQAVFLPTAYPLTLSSIGGGGVTANGLATPPATFFPASSSVLLAATPSSGWSFLGWGGTTNSMANPLNLTMTETQNVQAVFGTVLGVNVVGSGSVLTSSTNPVPYGTSVTLTAVPSPGYQLAAWSGALSGNSNPATLIVTSATPSVGALFALSPTPVISVQPSNASVIVGNTATFSVQASGATPLTYQWRKAGMNIGAETGTNYVIPSTTTEDAGNYDVVVQNGFGSSVTSTVVTLTVLVPVAITNQPADQVASFAGSATFTLGAYGNPTPFYQWLFNGAFITNAFEDTLTVTNIGTNLLGDYSVIAWNSFSVATSSVARLFMSPSIRAPFVGGTAVWGHETSLMVGAIGSGDLYYQWYLNGSPVSGGTNATLYIASVQFTNGGLYSVVISSAYGSTTNIPYQLVIYPAEVSLGLRASLTIGGVVGYGYEIQYSTNLADTNSWISITNLTLTQPVEVWVDTSADVRDQPRRYYKVLPQ